MSRAAPLLALMPLAYLLVLLRNYSLGVPFYDDWDLMLIFPKSYEGTLSFTDLFALQNEHRLLFPRLIMLALGRLTHWNQACETALSVILAAASLVLACAQLRATQRLTGQRLTVLVPLLALLFFSLGQWQNWFMPSQFLLFFHALAAIATILALTQPRLTPKHFIAALALAVMTSYSFANGLAIWPIGLLCLITAPNRKKKKINWPSEDAPQRNPPPVIARRRAAIAERRRPSSGRRNPGGIIPKLKLTPRCLFPLIWSVAGALVIALYLHGYEGPAKHPSPWLTLRHPIGHALYILNYLGSPVVNFSVLGATLAGAAGLAILIGSSILLLKRRGAHAATTLLPYWTFAAYAISAAAITGLGRLGFGLEQATSSRYITIANMFWVSNAVLILLVAKKKSGRRAAAAALCLFAVLLGANSLYGTLKWTERYAFRLPAKAELLSGGNDQNLLQRLYPDPEIVVQRREILKKYHLGPFRKEQ